MPTVSAKPWIWPAIFSFSSAEGEALAAVLFVAWVRSAGYAFYHENDPLPTLVELEVGSPDVTLTVVDVLALLDIGPLDVTVVRVVASRELMGTLVGVPPGSIELTGVGVVPPGNVSFCFVFMSVLLASG